jgi:murein L,D-transpeptidase YcbB/YkuD
MKKYVMFLLLLLVVTCKQKTASTPIPTSAAERKYSSQNSGIAFDSAIVTGYGNAKLIEFYRRNGFHTIWNRSETRRQILEAITAADENGLEPDDYHAAKWAALELKTETLTEKEFIFYDIGLTIETQKYLRHLLRGKLNPRELYTNWDLTPDMPDINAMISDGIRGDSLPKVLRDAEPSHAVYQSLKKALKIIDEFPRDRIRRIDIGERKLFRNDTSWAMVTIKKRLIYWNDMKSYDSMGVRYDKRAFKAIKKFQHRHGLAVDGIIGKGTIAALNFSKTERRQQIIANMERWRWFPRDLGDSYFLINIPDYALYVIKDRDTIDQKRIVVGKSERKSPVLSSTFSNIIFNPTWTVPPTIVREDLTPDASRDRNYFARRNIIIYDYKGNMVDPLLWKPWKAKSYRYVQCPGDDNALGNVKFNFPNHYTVYLHDTDHRNLFGINKRSLSSGCIRVENPLPLAEYMLDDEDNWSMGKIMEVVASKETTTVPLKQMIRIHQLYWTAWSEDDKLIFRDDIYNLDYALYASLRK